MKALGLVALGAAVACNVAVGEAPADAGAALVVQADSGTKTPKTPKPPKAPRVPKDAGTDPVDAAPAEPDPCYYVSFEVEVVWPGAHEALQNAAARWHRWYVPGGVECELRVLSSAERNIGGAGNRGDIVLNTASDVILDDVNCDGDRALLVDVLTHELGHVYGLGHSDARQCAMCAHEFCEPVAPTRREIRLANRCNGDGPPVGAECPP